MRIFHNVTEANRWYWKALLVSQLFPFLWAELHHIGTERCDLLQEFEKIFGYKKARTKHEFCASYWDSVFNCR